MFYVLSVITLRRMDNRLAGKILLQRLNIVIEQMRPDKTHLSTAALRKHSEVYASHHKKHQLISADSILSAVYFGSFAV